MITICDGCPCLYADDFAMDMLCCLNYNTYQATDTEEREHYSKDCQLHEIKYGDKVFRPERRES